MSRREILTLVTIIGGTLALPVGWATTYLFHQKLTDPHLLRYDFNGAVMAASWSPDGTRVALVGWAASPATWGNQALKVFDPLTGNTLVTGDTSNKVVSGLAPLAVVWSVDGQQLVAFVGEVTPINDGSRVVEIVQVWDAETGQRVRSFPVTPPVISQGYGSNLYTVTVRQSALDTHYLALEKIRAVNLNSQQRDIRFLEVWDIGTGSIIFTQDIQDVELRDMQWAPDNRRLAIWTDDKLKSMHWEIWDIPTGQRGRSFPMIYNPLLSTMLWSPDGKSIAFGPDVYDVETGRKVMTYQVAGQQTLGVMAWSPDEKRVVVRSFFYPSGRLFSALSHPLFVLDRSSSRKLAQYADINGSLIWSPNGAYFLALENSSGTVDVWRML